MNNEITKLSKSDLIFIIGLLVNCLKKATDFKDCEKLEQLILKYVTILAKKEN